MLWAFDKHRLSVGESVHYLLIEDDTKPRAELPEAHRFGGSSDQWLGIKAGLLDPAGAATALKPLFSRVKDKDRLEIWQRAGQRGCTEKFRCSFGAFTAGVLRRAR